MINTTQQRWASCTLLILGLLCLSSSTQAQDLSLEQALQRAAENNYQILIQHLAQTRAQQDAQSARLQNVPTLSANTNWRDRPPPFPEGPRRRTLDYGGALQWTSPIGTALELSASASEQFTGAIGAQNMPSNASLRLSAIQPLLRGAGLAGAWTPVELADLDAEVTKQRVRDALNALLVSVEAAYWDLAFAQADLKIKTRSRDRARAQFEDTRENIARGLLAESVIYVIEENLVFFEAQLIRAGESLTLAQSQLARLLQQPPGTPLVATSDLTPSQDPLPTWEEAVQQALAHNPTLTQSQLETQRADLILAFEDNLAMPSLDLRASFALNGLGDGPAPAWSGAVGPDRPEASVGLVFSVPLSNQTRRAAARAAQTRREETLIALKDTEQTLRFQIRDLLTSLVAQRQRLTLTQKRVDLARKKLDAEVERYRSGISSLDAVSRFQRDLDNTLITEQRALVDLRVARSRLRAAQGTLHRRYGLEVR